MKTKQVLFYSKDDEEFIKLLKDCNLRERFILYSSKEIMKEFIKKLDNQQFNIKNFKSFFSNNFEAIFNFKMYVDTHEGAYIASNKNYCINFSYLDNDDNILKHIQISISE